MRLAGYALILLLFIPVATEALSSSITRLSFISESSTVEIGLVSDQLTVQLQNVSGESEDTSETMDVTFTSSSATGEFLNSSGNVVTKTMSTGTANKNFFYRDSKGGTHLVTVLVTGRSTGSTFKATQNIIVGSGGTPTGDTGTTTGSGVIQGTSTASLNRSSSALVGTDEQTTDFSIQIGKARIGTVGLPLYFNSSITPLSQANLASVSWSFGDGTAGYGSSVSHSYIYPGQYLVVGRAQIDSRFAIARASVNILPLAVEIGEVVSGSSGYISVQNNSSYEAAVSNFHLSKGSQLFKLPQDTFIPANSYVRLAARISGIQATQGDTIELRNPSGEVVDSFPPQVDHVVEEIILPAKTNLNNAQDTKLIPVASNLAKLERVVLRQTEPVFVAEIKPPALSAQAQTIVIERRYNFFEKFLALPRNVIGSLIASF